MWPLLQRNGTICAILVEGIMQEEQFCEIILVFGPVVQEEMSFEIFLSGALATLVFVGAELLS